MAISPQLAYCPYIFPSWKSHKILLFNIVNWTIASDKYELGDDKMGWVCDIILYKDTDSEANG